MYCVEWNVLNAKPFRKSRGWRRPATGRICQPVRSLAEHTHVRDRNRGGEPCYLLPCQISLDYTDDFRPKKEKNGVGCGALTGKK
jgi:hypothetical protein